MLRASLLSISLVSLVSTAVLCTSLLAAPAARANAPLTAAQERRVTPVVRVVQAVSPAVVNIAATHRVSVPARSPFEFWEHPRGRQRETTSVGSGIVIHPSGYVLTNHHVIAQASALNVVFPGGRKHSAQVVASAQGSDVAIIKFDAPAGQPFVPLGRSDDLMVGEDVIAIGNPLGLGHTVTTGIVSAVDRQLPLSESATFEHLIQTDAAINPGNSGGPLLNALGELVGINTAIRGDAQNVGFAIAIDEVARLLPRLLDVRHQGRFRLGLTLAPGAPGDGPGAHVAGVRPGSPAAKAGLEPGMRVMAVGERASPRMLDALVALLEAPIGRDFMLHVQDQGGEARALRVRIQEDAPPEGRALAKAMFGMETAPLDARTAKALRVRPGAAVRVTRVQRGSAAARGGIRAGDLVTQCNGYAVRTPAELGLVLEDIPRSSLVWFSVVRRGRRGRLVRADTRLQAAVSGPAVGY